jgi:NAD+ synthase (glutamine-hydrolysing)
MSQGFVRVAAAIPQVMVADCDFNRLQIEQLMLVAESKGVQ